MITVEYLGPRDGVAKLEARLLSDGVEIVDREVRATHAETRGVIDPDVEVLVDIVLSLRGPSGGPDTTGESVVELAAIRKSVDRFKRIYTKPARFEVSEAPG